MRRLALTPSQINRMLATKHFEDVGDIMLYLDTLLGWVEKSQGALPWAVVPDSRIDAYHSDHTSPETSEPNDQRMMMWWAVNYADDVYPLVDLIRDIETDEELTTLMIAVQEGVWRAVVQTEDMVLENPMLVEKDPNAPIAKGKSWDDSVAMRLASRGWLELVTDTVLPESKFFRSGRFVPTERARAAFSGIEGKGKDNESIKTDGGGST